MFRMWGKVFADNHLLKDFVVENPSLDMTRTKKVFAALETIAHEFDLAVPIWLPSNISDFKRHAKHASLRTVFIEAIDFDYLEIQIIEED